MEGLNKLASIPVKVVAGVEQDGTALAKSLLHEITVMVNRLLDCGETGVLDFRALPALGDKGYRFLQEKLGVGEISAEIDSFGRSEIRECAFPGIWWITHYSQNGEVYTELIEVCFVPELLKSPRDDVVAGSNRLNKLLQDLSEEAVQRS